MTSTPQILKLTGYLGQDVEVKHTKPRDYVASYRDPILDGEFVTRERTTTIRDYACVDLAVHDGFGSKRTTKWYHLRAWDLDHHPDELRLRTAKKGQLVEVEGYEVIHRYKHKQSGEMREFRSINVTSFRIRHRLPRPAGRRHQVALT